MELGSSGLANIPPKNAQVDTNHTFTSFSSAYLYARRVGYSIREAMRFAEQATLED